MRHTGDCARLPLVEAAVLRAAEPTFLSQPIPATADPERHQAAMGRARLALTPELAARCEARGRTLTIVDAADYARSVIAELLAEPDRGHAAEGP